MSECTIPNVANDDGDGRWLSQHKYHLALTKEREPDVVLIGDSIMFQLQFRPVWSELYEPLHCLNFGVPGDKTQNVLYRIVNGELDNIKPKVVVVHVGTNNTQESPDEVAEGIVKIVNEVRQHVPESYIVVVDLLPRGQHSNKLRTKNEETNKAVRLKLAAQNLPRVETVKADKGLIQADGSISYLDMPDFLHLSDAGYRKAFEPLYDLLTQLLFENETENDFSASE